MGVSTKTLAISSAESLFERLTGKFQPGSFCLAMSAGTLAAMDQDPGSDLEKLFDGILSELLVFGCTSAQEDWSALLALTAGAISGIEPLDGQAQCFRLPREASSLSRQLAGLSFPGKYEEPAFAFDLAGQPAAADVILTANERPVFLRLLRGSAALFLLSGPLPDVNRPLSRRHGAEEHYAALIPPLILLRSCFQQSCWRAPQSTARFIIDDPGLSMSYGFLDYGLLKKSMQRFRYGTSIAFIPWNCWRTTMRNVQRLLGEGSSLSICIHGCDHSNREFETPDAALLDTKAGLAMQRMEAQQRRTGAVFEPVMVFPQGRFSATAIPALRANHYLAAVNTTVFPVDHGPEDLTIGDLLRPAVTRYSGFPVFSRHYPRRIFDFAFDLFLGKPALIVEHHQFFRGGCEAPEAVAAALYAVDPSLSWPSLTDQLMRSCLQRTLPDGSTEVMFFTRRFQLQNREGCSEHFLLIKHEPDAGAIESVSVDGVTVPYSIKDGFLKLEIQAHPDQVRNIEILDRAQTRRKAGRLGIVYNAGVLLRRGLSEFRDHTLAKNERILRLANRIAKKLKITGAA
jgi:hypothetical protein